MTSPPSTSASMILRPNSAGKVRLATPHDGCVGFEQADQLGGGGHAFAAEHPPLSLFDDLLDQRCSVLQRRR